MMGWGRNASRLDRRMAAARQIVKNFTIKTGNSLMSQKRAMQRFPEAEEDILKIISGSCGNFYKKRERLRLKYLEDFTIFSVS